MLKQKLFKLVSEKVYTCASLPVSDCGSLCTVKACHLESILQQCSSNVRNNSVKTAAHDAFFSGFFIFFLQTKVVASETRGNFEEVLSSAANASSQETPTNNLTDSSERPC